MAARVLASAALTKSHSFTNLISNFLLRTASGLNSVISKACGLESSFGYHRDIKTSPFLGHLGIHSGSSLKSDVKVVEQFQDSEKSSAADGDSNGKRKRKKLKGKRAVVRWLKFFRWKKKKEYQRMTAEEKILYKLKKAQKKEERLLETLKKIEPAESSETTHDPEILTPEEHFYFLKMGLKCKNYVPVGRRGIYQGVILNMHLHWKKHQTLQVIVKTFSPEEVKEIAAELARMTGGIVLDIHEDNTIIMYRGKNYSQPPTEIMSPRVTLSRKKALDKSKCRDGLRAVRKYIPKLGQELEMLQAQLKSKPDCKLDAVEDNQNTGTKESVEPSGVGKFQSGNADKLHEILYKSRECSEDGADTDTELDLEDLSGISEFEIDSETENEVKEERPLYLDKFEEFPDQNDGEIDDFEEHLRQISMRSKNSSSMEDVGLPNFDEVDKIVLRAASLLKKKRT